MARTLLIIDMQIGFATANEERVIENVCEEVYLAKKRGAGILVVEYRGFGKTIARITDTIGNYVRQGRTTKVEDDGSKQVFNAARRLDFDMSRWRVCGVNIAYCVSKTVQGLHTLIPDTHIEIRKRACNCSRILPESWKVFNQYNGQYTRAV